MSIANTAMANNTANIVIVDAPQVSLAQGEQAEELLLHFYRALGWNGEDVLNPCKIRTTQEVYENLFRKLREFCPDPIKAGMFLVNIGPGVDNYIPNGKVYLLEGWIEPAKPIE